MKKTALLVFLFVLISQSSKAQVSEDHVSHNHKYSQVSIDGMFGDKGLISEFFFLKSIDDNNRWLAISRSELHLPDYDNDAQEFVNFNTFSYNFKNGLGIAAGTYASTHYNFSTRLGLQYFKESEKFLFYTYLSTAVTNEADGQLLVLGAYTPELSHNWKLYTRAEWRSAISYEHGHAFSNQLLRLGFQYKEIVFGAGAELEEQGEDFEEFECNVGPFVRILF
ncbi:MAG: hypothetical protein QM710_11600 [Flavobacterium sp.]